MPIRRRRRDPLLVFSVLYSFWVADYVAFNGDGMRELATQFMRLAEKHGATVPLMVGHRLMGMSLVETGEIAQGREHYNQALALYDPGEHRPLATPIWPRHSGVSLVLSVEGFVDTWPSRGRARRLGPSHQRCARDRPSRRFDACVKPCSVYLHPLR
jgi:hypothetical protein